MGKTKKPADTSSCLHPHLSADEVHKNILRLKAMKARIDARLFMWIGILIERKCHKPLGYSTAKSYLKHFLKYGKSETNEIIRVSKKLLTLGKIAKAFEKGEISWSHLKAITRVAKPHRQERWLSFALTHSADALIAEARDAERNGRDHPREGSYGLPNILVDERFLLTREEQEIVRKALEKKGWELRAASDDEEYRPSAVECLVAIAKDELAKADEAADAAAKESHERAPSFEVVYIVCKKCGASGIQTEDGLVEVSHEHVKSIEGEATMIEIESKELVRGEAVLPDEVEGEVPAGVIVKVLALHDHRCAHCGRRLGLHIHHVIFRCHQGPHEVWNLLVVCRACHSNIHRGDLEVIRDARGTLHWTSRADRIASAIAAELKELA